MMHFRTWSTDNDVAGSFCVSFEKIKNSNKHILTIGSSDLYLERSTEKFDINGVEIFENDIILVTDETMIELFDGFDPTFFIRKYVVIFEDNNFKIRLHGDEINKYSWPGNRPVFEFPDGGHIKIEVVGSTMEEEQK